jgi:nucleoside-diphosphate-sugar epimerase
VKHILITGITGLIGNAVLTKLLQSGPDSFEITALVRPGTNAMRLQQISDSIRSIALDLCDIAALKAFLENERFDLIIHIGALRGGRRFNKKQFYASNVQSTEQLVEYALKYKSRLLFCSSVGVFGAIPDEMPANNESPYKEDNYYHYTKIMCEKAINRAILKGLDAVIVRPSITYGPNDRGFPFTMVKLVSHRLFLPSKSNIWMHLCNIDTISATFVSLATDKATLTGKAFNVADVEPVQQRDLANFIYRQLYNKNYPKILTIDNDFLRAGEKVARFMHNELWTTRFELISHSWFYQVHDTYEALELPMHYTIPDFKLVVSDYLKNK